MYGRKKLDGVLVQVTSNITFMKGRMDPRGMHTVEYNKATKHLKISLFTSSCQVLIGCYFIWFNIYLNHPPIFNIVLILCILIILYFICMTSLDLIYKDKRSISGTLSEKRHNKILVKGADGKKHVFRLPNEQFEHLKEGAQVELHYYRRTKTVTAIGPVPSLVEEDYSI